MHLVWFLHKLSNIYDIIVKLFSHQTFVLYGISLNHTSFSLKYIKLVQSMLYWWLTVKTMHVLGFYDFYSHMRYHENLIVGYVNTILKLYMCE